MAQNRHDQALRRLIRRHKLLRNIYADRSAVTNLYRLSRRLKIAGPDNVNLDHRVLIPLRPGQLAFRAGKLLSKNETSIPRRGGFIKCDKRKRCFLLTGSFEVGHFIAAVRPRFFVQ